jgi:hypothetical protein
MNRGLQGRLVRQTTASEPFEAFVPYPLPPDPPLEVDLDLLERANRAVGRLDALTLLLRDPSLFLYFYVRKDGAVRKAPVNSESRKTGSGEIVRVMRDSFRLHPNI